MQKTFSLIAILLFVLSTHAQSGDISGKVKDPRYDWAIDNAIVELIDTAGTPSGHGSKADSDGNYIISPLKPGIYNITISAYGFLPVTIKGIIVNSEKTTFVNASLQPDPNVTIKKKKSPRFHKIVSY